MWCPKCQDGWMEVYERLWDYTDEQTMIGQEHYYCPNCDSTFSRDVTFILEKAGELEE